MTDIQDNKSPDLAGLRELLGKVGEFTAPGLWNSHDRSSMIWAPSLKGGETRLLDVRGWGYLTGGGHGALGWDDDRAIEAQKAIGKLVAQAVNALPALLDIAEENGRLRAAPKEKRAPVQGLTGGIPWSLHLKAYDAYCKRYREQPALIDLEGRNCRGGFSVRELDEFVPGWREELSELTALRKRAEKAEAELAECNHSFGLVAAQVDAAEAEAAALRDVVEQVAQLAERWGEQGPLVQAARSALSSREGNGNG